MSTGQWLFAEAAQTGDWESAALALRSELVKATADRDALIASMELAWSLVPQPPAVVGRDPVLCADGCCRNDEALCLGDPLGAFFEEVLK